jgi:hypothetical protein
VDAAFRRNAGFRWTPGAVAKWRLTVRFRHSYRRRTVRCTLLRDWDCMARNIRIINARDFLTAKPDGVLNLEEGEQLLRDVVNVSQPLDEFDILLDTREALSNLSASDLWFLADLLGRFPETFGGKIAILCPRDRLDHASYFALCGQNKGIAMQAFTSYEDAMTWLNEMR